MSRSDTAAPSWFSFIACLSFGGAIAVAAAWYPFARNYAQHQSSVHADRGVHASSLARQVAEFRFASVLNPSDTKIRRQLAEAYVQHGNLDIAVSTLGDSQGEKERKAELQLQLGKADAAVKSLEGISSTKADITRTKALMEQGKYSEASDEARGLEGDDGTAIFAVALAADGKTAEADGTALLIQDKARSARMLNVAHSQVALAQELYSLHLHHSVLHILANSKEESSTKYRILASSYLALGVGESDLRKAQQAAQKGIKLNPSDTALRELLRDIYTKQGDVGGADQQKQMIDKLRSGSI